MTKRIDDWLAEAEEGQVIMYLQADSATRRPDVAAKMMTAAEEGLVFLYRKRARAGIFNHYAKRVSKRTGKIIKPTRREDYE